MILQDYIMRMIAQLVKVLAKILFNKETGDFRAANNEIESAFKNITGMDYFMLSSLSDKDIISLLNFSKDNATAGVKCLVIAKLLKEKAELPQDEKLLESDPGDEFIKSLSLYLEGINNINTDDIELDIFIKDLDDMISQINDDEIPNEIRIKILKYYQLLGRSEAAERESKKLKESGQFNS